MTIKGKDLIERISGKEYSEDLLKELEKYEVKRPKSVWELKNDDEIWMTFHDGVNSECASRKTEWYGWESQDYNRKLGKIHLTKARAELHARVLNTELAIKKWKRENDNVGLDWNDNSKYKYYWMYYGEIGEICIDWTLTLKFANTIYFSSRDKAQQCINDIGEERITEWLKWEDNDQ